MDSLQRALDRTGLPGLREMRSLNRAGLSLVTLVFSDATDVYFARQLVLELVAAEAVRQREGRGRSGAIGVVAPVATVCGGHVLLQQRGNKGRRAPFRKSGGQGTCRVAMPQCC